MHVSYYGFPFHTAGAQLTRETHDTIPGTRNVIAIRVCACSLHDIPTEVGQLLPQIGPS